MSKTLLLLRHAKSSWDAPAHSDFERPLNRRGERSAAVIGIMMKQEKIVPDLILCSSARRTLQTRDIIRPYFPRNCPVEETSRIYEASVKEIFSVLSEIPDNVQKPLLIGHNPGIQELALMLTGEGNRKTWQTMWSKFPTAALAVLLFDVANWREIKARSGNLVDFKSPKMLKRNNT